MARIRTIKPEFFTSEDIVALSPLARILYIALWCEADKEGRMLWKPKTFKMRYLPADDCDIGALCAELIDGGLVVLYGDGLAHIPAFVKHQHVNPRESVSTLPAPEDAPILFPKKITESVRQEVFERDGHECTRCGSTDRLTLDHILPQSMGGPHIAENLRVVCRSCNCERPVSGRALQEDLLRDGFTVETLREKFGLDASRRVGTRATQDVHAQVGREGKGKEGKTRDASAPPPGFAEFWAKYPNKSAKKDAIRAWQKLSPDESTQVSILKAVDRQRQGEDWRKEGGRFVPHAATWLNGERWLDEPPEVATVIRDIFAGAK
jgi:hypothetical protein